MNDMAAPLTNFWTDPIIVSQYPACKVLNTTPEF